MNPRQPARVASLTIAIGVFRIGTGGAHAPRASWLDAPKPASWNKPGLSIPAAPRTQGAIDPRCQDSARPAELEEDKRLRDQGWDLVGADQRGWQIVVVRATASY